MVLIRVPARTTGGAAGGGFWEELARTTLAVAGDLISVTPIAARKYLMVLIDVRDIGGSIQPIVTFNGDVGTNYDFNRSNDFGAGAKFAGFNDFGVSPLVSAFTKFIYMYILNVATIEKQIWASSSEENNVNRLTSGTWTNVIDQITRVDVINDVAGGATGDFAIGSEVVVLGSN